MSSIRTITRLDPGQFGLVIGSMYLIVGIVGTILLAIFVKLASSVAPPSAGLGGLTTGFGLVVFPIVYAVFGYIFGVLSALVYNLLVGIVGGIKVTVSDQ